MLWGMQIEYLLKRVTTNNITVYIFTKLLMNNFVLTNLTWPVAIFCLRKKFVKMSTGSDD